ncbi:glycosyltransferase [bacterium]|nr:glycosyltransferase [bacterium]
MPLAGMKILHLSKMDSGGGAADGFVRIHSALLSQGHESVAYVIKRNRSDVPAMVDARRLLGPLQKLTWGIGRIWAKLRRLHLKPVGVYDFDTEANFPAEPIIRDARARALKWDMVVVHWAGAFVTAATIRQIAETLGARVILWQVDMAHVTGGCHSNLGCPKYQTGCGACPLIGSKNPTDLSAEQSAERRRIWREIGAVLLAPTEWSARQARESSITGSLPAKVFPIPLNLDVLHPVEDPRPARTKLGLPAEARVLLVRGIDPALTYKGFGLLLEALRLLDAQGVALHVAVLGETGLMGEGWKHITYTELGVRRGDAAIAVAYQSADFFVNPSTNDNGPMMVGEALVCGVPVVAYPVGLPSVPWAEGQVGRVAEPIGDIPALAAAIRIFATMPAAELAAKKHAAAAAARPLYAATYFSEQLTAALQI